MNRCYLKINFIPLKAFYTYWLLLINWINELVWLDFSRYNFNVIFLTESNNQFRNFHNIPPEPEKLQLEVGTPWVDRKRVPVFFVIWTTQICHFLESAPTQRGAHLSLSPTQVFRGVSIFHFSSTQVFQRVAHLSLFINPSFSEGCPSLTFHQPKFLGGCPSLNFMNYHWKVRDGPPSEKLGLMKSERWAPL